MASVSSAIRGRRFLVALNPHSEPPDLNVPGDYRVDHPHEHPSDWGWHGQWGRAGRVAGWIAAIMLVLMTTSTHYNESGTAWLLLSAAGIVVILLWDRHSRKNAWRK
jgi:Protein of unknown function (DUF2631)